MSSETAMSSSSQMASSTQMASSSQVDFSSSQVSKTSVSKTSVSKVESKSTSQIEVAKQSGQERKQEALKRSVLKKITEMCQLFVYILVNLYFFFLRLTFQERRICH